MGDLQTQEGYSEKNRRTMNIYEQIEKVINDEIFTPVYEPPNEIFNRRKYMLKKKR